MLSFSVLTFILLLSFMQMPSLVQQQRMEVEQLRRAAAMKRIPVSQAVEDIKVRENKGRNIGKISERRFLSQYCRSDSLCDNFHVFLRPSPPLSFTNHECSATRRSTWVRTTSSLASPARRPTRSGRRHGRATCCRGMRTRRKNTNKGKSRGEQRCFGVDHGFLSFVVFRLSCSDTLRCRPLRGGCLGKHGIIIFFA